MWPVDNIPLHILTASLCLSIDLSCFQFAAAAGGEDKKEEKEEEEEEEDEVGHSSLFTHSSRYLP